MKNTLVPITDIPEADILIFQSLEKCANEIKVIGQKYQNSRIGDTGIDEEILATFYEMLHS